MKPKQGKPKEKQTPPPKAEEKKDDKKEEKKEWELTVFNVLDQ